MSEFTATFKGNDEIQVVQPSTGHRWHFLFTAKGRGRRRLDGPIGATFAASADHDLMRSVHEFAHAEAMKAGRIDA